MLHPRGFFLGGKEEERDLITRSCCSPIGGKMSRAAEVEARGRGSGGRVSPAGPPRGHKQDDKSWQRERISPASHVGGKINKTVKKRFLRAAVEGRAGMGASPPVLLKGA